MQSLCEVITALRDGDIVYHLSTAPRWYALHQVFRLNWRALRDLTPEDRDTVVSFMIAQLGLRYDMRNIFAIRSALMLGAEVTARRGGHPGTHGPRGGDRRRSPRPRTMVPRVSACRLGSGTLSPPAVWVAGLCPRLENRRPGRFLRRRPSSQSLRVVLVILGFR